MRDMIPFYNELLKDEDLHPTLKENIIKSLNKLCRIEENIVIFLKYNGIDILLGLIVGCAFEKSRDLKLGILLIGFLWNTLNLSEYRPNLIE